MYPKLLKELNDSHAAIPAYYRFQNQDPTACLLRNDLKDLKAKHFQMIYNRELYKPKHTMADIEYKNKGVSGTNFFELKYFLSEKLKQENFQEQKNKKKNSVHNE